MTDRTKIERVGGHLLIDDRDIVATADMGIGRHITADFNEVAGRFTLQSTHGSADVEGWTAREVLEVAYGPEADVRGALAGAHAEIHRRLVRAWDNCNENEVAFELHHAVYALDDAMISIHEAAGVER